MSTDVAFAYPLHEVADSKLQDLSCPRVHCPGSRSKRLVKFWHWYKETTGPYVPELFTQNPALGSHDDPLDILRLVKSISDVSRSELTQEYFSGREDEEKGTPEPILFMTNYRGHISRELALETLDIIHERAYHYFGSRLAELYDELQNPTLRGWFQTWLKRRSGARYVMMATLIGVVIATVIGLLGLGVASFQAWIAWQQWKHPVSP
ncbi:hypothetical protein BCR34DRAFT_621819 [Clohesyomyces aquaticus]|uniref:Uncharacterized protein n=1 Tax=Clohesyomyces aquaticus TaxID=1231657 RepID=A0A1Y2A554_9PLEO|nr:hypothetical protein BCR34DRAFT_621819 [Clohesyomyces aquaticus]